LSFIELEKVSFFYDNQLILDSIDEKIEQGSCNIITSISGEGKTTLLKLIAGLKSPSSGNIYIDNIPISSFNKRTMLAYHRQTGFLFQDAALINNLNILDNLSLYYKYNTNFTQEEILKRLNPYLKFFDFYDLLDVKPEQISHGNQMIISFIRAISHQPKLLILDEPIETLDQILIQKMLVKLEEAKNLGSTLIIATHRISIFEKLADKVIILKNRKIMFSDNMLKLNQIEDNELKQLTKL